VAVFIAKLLEIDYLNTEKVITVLLLNIHAGKNYAHAATIRMIPDIKIMVVVASKSVTDGNRREAVASKTF
jgi:hypothetical protein